MSQNDGRILRHATIVVVATTKCSRDANAEAGDRRGVSHLIFREIRITSRGGSGRCFSNRARLDNE